MKQLNERAMLKQEKLIPELASKAVNQAYKRALNSGSNVLEVVNGQLIESHPDGSSRVLKQVAPSLKVTAGSKRILKRRESS